MTISNRCQVATLTVPAMTASMSPTTQSVELGWCFLHEVEVLTPPGHNGYTGYNVTFNGLSIVPFTSTPTFIVANAETTAFRVDTEVDQFLSVTGYNTDQYSHSFYFRFFYTPIALMTPDLELVAWKAVY